MKRGYLGIPLLFVGACLGLGDLESDDETSSGGSGGGSTTDAAWPDAFSDGVSCQPGTKSCAGSCVPNDDPSFGCTPDDCTPCAIPGAKLYCQNLACVLDECLPGHLDCDGLANTGCEIDPVGDPNNCGACNVVCSNANGTGSCVGGACQIVCDAGFADCDGNAMNGCESSLETAQHCGTCAKKCPTGFSCGTGICHCINNAACQGGSFGACVSGECQCAGGQACKDGKKCTPEGCV